MAIKQKDRNRAELVQAIIKQTGGRIFSVKAKRKHPKHTGYILRKKCDPSVKRNLPFEVGDFLTIEQYKKYEFDGCPSGCELEKTYDNFMELSGRIGVKKNLKGGESTIKHKPELISLNLTSGEHKGQYRCFSAYNVLEIRSGGTVINFKEEDVLDFQE